MAILAFQKPDKVVMHIDNNKRESTFSYDLIKDKRFTQDQFEFHVPITINFKANSNNNSNMDTTIWPSKI